MHLPRRFFAPTAALVALAVAPAAQADVTATRITSPAKPRYVLYDTSAAHPKTLAVAGTATGSGSVDLVCQRGTEVVALLDSVPVAANGTFSAADVPLDAAADAGSRESPGRTCTLRALPAGASPAFYDAFRGPLLGVSKYSRLELSGTGANDGLLAGYYLYAAGIGYSAEAGAFGSCGLWSAIQDPVTAEVQGYGLACAGSAHDTADRLDVAIDGQAAYAPGAIDGGVAGSGIQGASGFPALPEPSVQLDETSGDVSVAETSPFARCAGDNAFPPLPWICTSFDRAPVQVQRTTSIAGGAQLIRVVDRWSSTDGRAHSLDLTIDEPACFGYSDCSDDLTYRFPGESAYVRHNAGDAVAGPLGALQPIFVKDAGAQHVGGAVILPGQHADGGRFFGADELGIEYKGRTIPAAGTLTLTHYYATVSGAEAPVETGADRLRAWIGHAAPAPAPHGGGSGTVVQTPARPRLSRHGRVRVRRSGRTFVVTTRDRAQCPLGGAACVLRVGVKARGATAGRARTLVPAGSSARVTFRLRHGAAGALRRLGRLRLKVSVAARAGTGPAVTKQRAVAIRLP